MRAYQCDRCGKFFAHSFRSTDTRFVTDTHTSAASNRLKDLCDDCQNELEEWWEKKKKGKKNEQASGEEKTEKAD